MIRPPAQEILKTTATRASCPRETPVPTRRASFINASSGRACTPASTTGSNVRTDRNTDARTWRSVAECSTNCYTRMVAKPIAQRELRNENARVIDAVVAGETFVVTRNGEPVAELRPIRAGRRPFISRDEVAALGATDLRIDPPPFR